MATELEQAYAERDTARGELTKAWRLREKGEMAVVKARKRYQLARGAVEGLERDLMSYPTLKV